MNEKCSSLKHAQYARSSIGTCFALFYKHEIEFRFLNYFLQNLFIISMLLSPDALRWRSMVERTWLCIITVWNKHDFTLLRCGTNKTSLLRCGTNKTLHCYVVEQTWLYIVTVWNKRDFARLRIVTKLTKLCLQLTWRCCYFGGINNNCFIIQSRHTDCINTLESMYLQLIRISRVVWHIKADMRVQCGICYLGFPTDNLPILGSRELLHAIYGGL